MSKISELGTAFDLDGSELVPVVQNGTTSAATVSQFRAGLSRVFTGSGAPKLSGKQGDSYVDLTDGTLYTYSYTRGWVNSAAVITQSTLPTSTYTVGTLCFVTSAVHCI